MKNIDTLIFDLDGTILDTLGDLADSVNFALESHGLPKRTCEEIRSFVGNGIKENCVYIGDSEVDFYTAKNADMKLVMVSWGFRDRKVLEDLNVELIADTPKELFEIIVSLD